MFSFGKGPTGHCACEGEGVPPGAAAEARSAPSPYPNFVPRLPHVMLIELRALISYQDYEEGGARCSAKHTELAPRELPTATLQLRASMR